MADWERNICLAPSGKVDRERGRRVHYGAIHLEHVLKRIPPRSRYHPLYGDFPMLNRSLRTSALALAGILITIGGCSESPSAVGPRQFVARSASARFSASGSSAAVIDARGGTLETSAGDRIVFPAGALGSPTPITITSRPAQGGV